MRSIFKAYFSTWLGKLLYNPLTAFLFLGKQHSVKKEDQPKALVPQFPTDIPLVVIASRQDKIVPFGVSYDLALRVAVMRNKLRAEVDVAPVYFIELEKPGHNGYGKKGAADTLKYNQFVHAIYREHHLPYLPQYANHVSPEMLKKIELTAPIYNPMWQLQQEYWQKKSARKEISQQAIETLRQLQKEGVFQDSHLIRYAPIFSQEKKDSSKKEVLQRTELKKPFYS